MIENPLVLFDGVCNLCNGTVNFILKRDKKKQFRFVPLQSEAGKKLKKKFFASGEMDSVALIYREKIYFESEAVLMIARLLPPPWRWAAFFRVIPVEWRNRMYRCVAKNRYRWFGKKTACRIPTPEEKRFFPEREDLNL